MKVGVNYTPRQGWFHSWLDLEEPQVAADFEAIAGLGLDHVRIFPLWPILQPSRGLVMPRAVKDLLRVVDLAGEAGLQVSVDVLNGHLSSFDFLPSWLTTWHRRNLFTEPEVIDAQYALATELGMALRDRPHASGLCVGNEFAQFAAPRHPEQSRLEVPQADAWLTGMLEAMRAAWPDGRHVHCFDDDIWFVDEHPFTPQQAVTLGDATTVHSWVFGGVGPRFGAGHPSLTVFARYLVELALAWGEAEGQPDRPVWLQEVGAPISYVAPQDSPAFLRDTLLGVADAPRLEAVTWWCSHDVSRALPDFPELEYSLGLFDSEGRAKPIGKQLAELIPDLHAATPKMVEREAVGFVANHTRRSLTSPHGAVFDEWFAARQDGQTMRLSALRD